MSSKNHPRWRGAPRDDAPTPRRASQVCVWRGFAALALMWGVGLAGCGKEGPPAGGAKAPPPAPQSSAAPADRSAPAAPAQATKAPSSPAEEAPAPASAEALEIDPMFVTARELRDLLASENPPTLLDVRTEERFDAFHIPNALSLTLLQLGISAPSKMDNTIVVSAGHAADGVAEKVKDLREKGSTLRVLHGGMGAWCRLGGQTTMPCRGADRIGALDLVRVKDEPARLIFVVLSAADTKLPARLQQAEKLLSTARVITFTEPEQAVADMRRALEAEAAGQVVVVDGDGGGYGALRDLVAKELDALVFYLDGGLDAFEAAAEALKGPGDRKTMVSQGVGGTPKPGRPQVIRAPKGCGCL